MKMRAIHKNGSISDLDNVEKLIFFDGECVVGIGTTGKINDVCERFQEMCDSCNKACSPGVCAECDKQKQSYDFAKWVATEIFDDNWEYNKDAFEELACRKLEKLGIVQAKGDEWELVEPQESDVEQLYFLEGGAKMDILKEENKVITNGEMIMKLFPNAEVQIGNFGDDGIVCVRVNIRKCLYFQRYDLDWWKEEYKGGDEE